jgi:MtN3 and saliva related transmembrane protein
MRADSVPWQRRPSRRDLATLYLIEYGDGQSAVPIVIRKQLRLFQLVIADLHETHVRRRVMGRLKKVLLSLLLLTLIVLASGCEEFLKDTSSLFIPGFKRSEIFGFVAGLGTTFAVFPDLVAMLRRRSSAGMNPRMAAIIGTFQILWVYYGVLIVSRPVVAWNVIGVLINFFSVGAYSYFVRKERAQVASRSES